MHIASPQLLVSFSSQPHLSQLPPTLMPRFYVKTWHQRGITAASRWLYSLLALKLVTISPLNKFSFMITFLNQAVFYI